ncbi:MAG: hypothetical protein ABEI78_01760, partial [Candidatus Nanohaloarchaea archaeon]
MDSIMVTSIMPASPLCIGNGCTYQTGQGGTSSGTLADTDDDKVDLGGDKMSGGLKTTTITTNSDICIGSGCLKKE